MAVARDVRAQNLGAVRGLVPDQHYVDLVKLGEGTYGEVFRGRDLRTGRLIALKKVRMETGWGEGIPTTALREISALQEVEHENIVKLEEVFTTPNQHLYLAFELLDRDLKACLDTLVNYGRRPVQLAACRQAQAAAQAIAAGRPIPPPAYGPGPLLDPVTGEAVTHPGLHPLVVKWYTYQLLQATQACHESRIVHRDIKPQNILLNAAGDLKLADFGLARTYQIPLRPYTEDVQTLWYRAPELLLGETLYSPAVDVWSVGCIMSEMACGAALFDCQRLIEMLHKMFYHLGRPTEEEWEGLRALKHYRDTFPAFKRRPMWQWAYALDEPGRDLLSAMLTYDPTRRITAAQALAHPWLDEVRRGPGGQVSEGESRARQYIAAKAEEDAAVARHFHADGRHR